MRVVQQSCGKDGTQPDRYGAAAPLRRAKERPTKGSKSSCVCLQRHLHSHVGGVALTGQMMAGSSVQCAATSSYGKQGAKAAYSPYTALHGEQGTTAAPDGRAHMYHKPLAHVHLHVGARMGALLQSNRWTTC